MRVDLVKLLPATFKEKHISEMIVNTLDMTKFSDSEDTLLKAIGLVKDDPIHNTISEDRIGYNNSKNTSSQELSFALGNTPFCVSSEDLICFNELAEYCFAEQVSVMIELTDQVGIEFKELASDSTTFSKSLEQVCTSFQNKYYCGL